jgi:spore coat polysaccharide biosynthesis protein SpsF
MVKKPKRRKKSKMTISSPLHVSIIVQARMGASRLPGKPLKKSVGITLLAHLLARLKRCKEASSLLVATTLAPKDALIVRETEKQGVAVYRGSEEDVLSRYLGAAHLMKADAVCRITADCPLIDPDLVDQMIRLFKETPGIDYLSNTLDRTFPRGMDIEIFKTSALEKAARSVDRDEREHVTLFLYRHPETFHLMNFCYSEDNSQLRWTVDTEDDLKAIRKILRLIYKKNPDFTLQELLELAKEHPEIAKLNAHVEQKKV